MADVDKVKRAKALKMKLELEAQAAQPPASNVTTPESSWFETLQNTAANALPSAGNLASNLWHGVTHPGEVAEGIRKLDVGSRQWLESLGGEHPEETPEMKATREAAEGFAETVRHPAIAFSNDPAGMLFDLATMFGGGAGKTLSVGRKGLNTAEAVEKATKASDYAHEVSNAFPEKNIDISTLGPAVETAARKARFRPEVFPSDAAAYPGLSNVIQKRTFSDLPGIARLRTEIQRVDRTGKGDVDSGLLGKAKKAFDEAVATITPEGSELLTGEREAFIKSRNVKDLANILESGKIKGAVAQNEGIQLGREVSKLLTSARRKRGFDENTLDELRDIVKDTPKNATLWGSIAPSWTGAMMGIPFIAHNPILSTAISMAGMGGPPLFRNIKGKIAGRAMTRDMEDLIRELADMPPDKRRLRIKKLGAKGRAAAAALYGLEVDQENR